MSDRPVKMKTPTSGFEMKTETSPGTPKDNALTKPTKCPPTPLTGELIGDISTSSPLQKAGFVTKETNPILDTRWNMSIVNAPREQTHEYNICVIDSRYNPELPIINIQAAAGWRLIAVVPDGAMRTLYFERAVKL